MNIIIIERLLRANEDSKTILENTKEQSIKRRRQLEEYNQTENKYFFYRMFNAIKSNWFC